MTTTDTAFDTLHFAGWSIGEIGGTNGWYVFGTRGEHVIDTSGKTAAEAWQQALEQAESLSNIVVDSARDLP